jgi:hypothetical protein
MKDEMQIIKEMVRILKDSPAVIYEPNAHPLVCIDSVKDKFFVTANNGHLTINYEILATALYTAGYRKQDEVATELLDEIIRVVDETSLAYQHGLSMKGIRTKGKTILYGKYEACSQFMSYLINLKNKYTSRGD